MVRIFEAILGLILAFTVTFLKKTCQKSSWLTLVVKIWKNLLKSGKIPEQFGKICKNLVQFLEQFFEHWAKVLFSRLLVMHYPW